LQPELLLAVAILSGLGGTFPTETSPPSAWRHLIRHWNQLAHAALGLLVLADAALLLIRSRRKPVLRDWLLPFLGFLLVALAVAAGVFYVSLRQPGAALGYMTAGWLGAEVVYLLIWIRARGALRAAAAASRRSGSAP
jgi:hypothetical protein